MICFKIRIFVPRQTSASLCVTCWMALWFALKFVSLCQDKHLVVKIIRRRCVVICFKIRIFVPRQTSPWLCEILLRTLWFALKFVSLCQDKHPRRPTLHLLYVVICFKIRIFVPRQTSVSLDFVRKRLLWFALKFVSLCQDKHPSELSSFELNCCDLL